MCDFLVISDDFFCCGLHGFARRFWFLVEFYANHSRYNKSIDSLLADTTLLWLFSVHLIRFYSTCVGCHSFHPCVTQFADVTNDIFSFEMLLVLITKVNRKDLCSVICSYLCGPPNVINLCTISQVQGAVLQQNYFEMHIFQNYAPRDNAKANFKTYKFL
jgi:hypothetical protein